MTNISKETQSDGAMMPEEIFDKKFASQIRVTTVTGGIAIVAALSSVVADRVRAHLEAGTTVTSLGMVSPGHEKIRVVHHFTDVAIVEVAAQNMAMSAVQKERPGILFRNGTVKVESYGHGFIGEKQITFTAETVTEEQSAIDRQLEDGKEKAKVADVEDKGNGIYGFIIGKSERFPESVLINTIAKFKGEHPGLEFDIINAPNHIGQMTYNDRDSYLIITAVKPEIRQ